MRELPDGYSDIIYTDVDVHLSYFDKWKLLFGWKFVIHIVTYCENKPGKVTSNTDIAIYRKVKLSIGMIIKEKKAKD